MSYPVEVDPNEVFEDTFTGEKYRAADLPLRICYSAAGYYVGQEEPGGCPFNRWSMYYATHGEASDALPLIESQARIENSRIVKF